LRCCAGLTAQSSTPGSAVSWRRWSVEGVRMETDEGLPFAANYPEAARPLSASSGRCWSLMLP